MVYNVNVGNFFDIPAHIKYFMRINCFDSVLHGIFIIYFNNITF